MSTTKYRRLHPEELKELEREFVKFLAGNSITGEDWEKLKKEENEKAESLIDVFSDFFWETSLANIKCVERRAPKAMEVYKFDDEKASVIKLTIQENATIDFTDSDDMNDLASGRIDLDAFTPEFFTGHRDYIVSREMLLFELIEQGARPCASSVYDSFQSTLKPKS